EGLNRDASPSTGRPETRREHMRAFDIACAYTNPPGWDGPLQQSRCSHSLVPKLNVPPRRNEHEPKIWSSAQNGARRASPTVALLALRLRSAAENFDLL